MVALLAEGVDRNDETEMPFFREGYVALLAEGVDRNNLLINRLIERIPSPSSRRAWIEILQTTSFLALLS